MALKEIAFVICLWNVVAYNVDAAGTQTHRPTNAEEIRLLKQTAESLSRQMILQQLFVEERIRTDGDSGLKTIRGGSKGSRPYYAGTYARGSIAAIHDHSNYDRTIGMGELNVVLNGVDFRTRHNDYKLMMPSTKTKDYNKLEALPFPDVPPSVKAKHTIQEQITEMQQYFKAFKNQDKSIRSDYEKYFKAALCYLEGGWTTDTKSISEPFHSDRHFLDASSWFDLLEKVRYTSYTGGKSNLENYSFLPTTIVDVKNSTPQFAQWNYRIACHPVNYGLRRSDLILIDDLHQRLLRRQTMDKFIENRAARFKVSGVHGIKYNASLGVGQEYDRYYGMEIMDYMMNEIPGKDNYPGYLNDNSFGMIHDDMAYKNNTRLNSARYHRWYKVEKKDAMGISVVHRGFNDQQLWVAQTSSPRIAPMTITDCPVDPHTHKRVCTDYTSRYTYAIPLEIIWLSPLYKWNPYDLVYNEKTYVGDGKLVSANGRNGGFTKDKAFNGTNSKYYYFTPSEFFHGGEVGRDPADTAKDTVGVLDKHGVVRRVAASGTRIFTPDIPDVGKLRMRYPIMPVHVEGNTVWKELDALKEMIMNVQTFAKYFERNPSQLAANSASATVQQNEHFTTSTTHKDPPGVHYHDLYLTPQDMTALSNNKTVTQFTTQNSGHQHQLEVVKDSHGRYIIQKCDTLASCWDGHSRILAHQHS